MVKAWRGTAPLHKSWGRGATAPAAPPVPAPLPAGIIVFTQ